MQNLSVDGILKNSLGDARSRATEKLQFQLHATDGKTGTNRATDLQAVAREFESLFVSHMLKVMRETIEDSGLTEGGLGKDIYTDLFDQEIARTIAKRSGLGLADLLVKRLAVDGAPTTGGARPVEQRIDSNGPDTSAKPMGSMDGGGPEVMTEDIPDFRMPVQAPITSAFGPRKDPFTHQVRFHKGVDLAAPEGMQVRAAMGGEVTSSGWEKGYGNTVVVQHPGGFQTRYAHLGSISVKAGDVLDSQQVLGSVGHTGRSTGSHLHFEVSRVGERIDPQVALAE